VTPPRGPGSGLGEEAQAFRGSHVGPVTLAGGSVPPLARRSETEERRGSLVLGWKPTGGWPGGCSAGAPPPSMTSGPRADAAHVTVRAAREHSGSSLASSPAVSPRWRQVHGGAYRQISPPPGPSVGSLGPAPLGGAVGPPSGGKASRF
jgi:hypothetical protein